MLFRSLNEPGLSGSVLLPTSWFSELTLQGIASRNETLFNSTQPGGVTPVAQLRNLWDLSEDLTFENNLFGASGKNAEDLTNTAIGTDVTIKWRPSEGGKYRSIAFTTEFLKAYFNGNADQPHLGGLASWLQVQVAQRWWVQGRAEWLGLPRGEGLEITRKQSALVDFFPSEFTGFRVQYDHVTQELMPTDHVVSLQWNLSIGAHPAHDY